MSILLRLVIKNFKCKQKFRFIQNNPISLNDRQTIGEKIRTINRLKRQNKYVLFISFNKSSSSTNFLMSVISCTLCSNCFRIEDIFDVSSRQNIGFQQSCLTILYQYISILFEPLLFLIAYAPFNDVLS